MSNRAGLGGFVKESPNLGMLRRKETPGSEAMREETQACKVS